MPTSGETAWEMTALDIVYAAMQELGIYGAGESDSVTAEELSDSLVRLNSMLKSWQTKANLFREATDEITVTGGTGEEALPSDVREINTVRYVASATNERLLAPYSRSDYLSLPNKAQAGTPSIYYVAKGVGETVLHVWPVPADDVTLKLDYSRQAETVTDGTETLDIPQEWHETVILGLASRIANMFGATRTDPATVSRVQGDAERLYQQMLDADRPDFYRFESFAETYG